PRERLLDQVLHFHGIGHPALEVPAQAGRMALEGRASRIGLYFRLYHEISGIRALLILMPMVGNPSFPAGARISPASCLVPLPPFGAEFPHEPQRHKSLPPAV